MDSSRTNATLAAVKDNALLLFGCVAVMWGLEIVDFLFRNFLDGVGIKPRSVTGLIGIATAPWLHLGFGHLVSNTIPFLVLGGIVLLGGRGVFVSLSLFIALVGGGLLWLLGPGNTNHIGASLVIFGYLGFLLSRGFFEKSLFWVLVSFGILVVYGWMIFGILPSERGVSWQGHLFGFAAGILGAWLMFPRGQELYRGGRPS
ncbi:MAG: rhomboid family intramembrane serine protease [Verrucomicrobiales bacterium]|nr:rhomboid family intramembrane serine protease [Verrucomicrobiales bacterium]